MKSLNTVVAVLVVLILAIALRNWPAVMQTAPVNLYAMTLDLSLSMMLLVGLVVVAVVHFATLGRIRMQAALESRDLHRELDRARRTAETAEVSRIAELRTYLEREIPSIELKLDLALERLAVPLAPAPATGSRAPY